MVGLLSAIAPLDVNDEQGLKHWALQAQGDNDVNLATTKLLDGFVNGGLSDAELASKVAALRGGMTVMSRLAPQLPTVPIQLCYWPTRYTPTSSTPVTHKLRSPHYSRHEHSLTIVYISYRIKHPGCPGHIVRVATCFAPGWFLCAHPAHHRAEPWPSPE